MSFKEKLVKLMSGRNGLDYLNKFIMIVCFILLVVNVFAQSIVLYVLDTTLLVIYAFRGLSRNLVRRQKENQVFYGCVKKITNFFKLQKNIIRDRKTHIYVKCPLCASMLRLPKISGEHTAKCPCCNNKFDIKIK